MFHVKHEGLRQAAEVQAGRELSDGQLDQLAGFEDLLRERAVPFGFVGASDEGRIRERHVLDSLRGAAVVGQDDRVAFDLGSGAGLPGIVVAIALPALEVTLVESRSARGAFLELAAQQLDLPNVRIFLGRAALVPGPADLCFARAFASAKASWGVARKILRPGGRLVYFGGRAFDPTTDVPTGVAALAVVASSVASSGPLVIMTQQ